MKAWNGNLDGIPMLTQRQETLHGIPHLAQAEGLPQDQGHVSQGAQPARRKAQRPQPYQPSHSPELQEAASPFWGVSNTQGTTSNSLPPSRGSLPWPGLLMPRDRRGEPFDQHSGWQEAAN